MTVILVLAMSGDGSVSGGEPEASSPGVSSPRAEASPPLTVRRCSAWRAVRFYQRRYREHAARMGMDRGASAPARLDAICPRYLAHVWQRKARALRLEIPRFFRRLERDSVAAICFVFGPYCAEALAVAECESGWSRTPRAQNGQYLGMFQMGSYARARYGHGPGRLAQARAAYRYFVESGRDWSPWSCKP